MRSDIHFLKKKIKAGADYVITQMFFDNKKFFSFEKILLNFKRQALHAKSLGFVHPTKNKQMHFESNLPKDFKKMLDFLEKFAN